MEVTKTMEHTFNLKYQLENRKSPLKLLEAYVQTAMTDDFVATEIGSILETNEFLLGLAESEMKHVDTSLTMFFGYQLLVIRKENRILRALLEVFRPSNSPPGIHLKKEVTNRDLLLLIEGLNQAGWLEKAPTRPDLAKFFISGDSEPFRVSGLNGGARDEKDEDDEIVIEARKDFLTRFPSPLLRKNATRKKFD